MSKWWKNREIGLRPTVCFVSDSPLGPPDGEGILTIIVAYNKGSRHPFVSRDGTAWAHAQPLGPEYFAGGDDE